MNIIARTRKPAGAEMLLLGIDVGTTNVKTVAYRLDGHPVASASARHPVHHPRPGWAEYDAEDLFGGVVATVREVMRQLKPAAHIAGVAVASMAETAVALDAKGRPLRPAIAWHDERTVPQSQWWQRVVGEDQVAGITGLPIMPIFGIHKLMWLREHEPAAYASIRCWLNTADYIAYRLCGVQATDYSLASRLMVFDLQAKSWSQELLAACDIPEHLFAEVIPSGQELGSVHEQAAAETTLPQGTPVVSGGMDHPCGALALGMTRSGDILDSMGTSESIFSVLDAPNLTAGLAQAGYQQGVHVVAERYYCNGGLYTSGACIEWLRELLFPEREDAYDAIIEAAAAAPPGSEGVFFLPHLRMANTPINDVNSRGAFIGLSAATSRRCMARAVLEGLAYEAQFSLDGLRERLTLDIERVRAIGGGTRNQVLMGIKAALLDAPVEVVSFDEATSLGAAILAGIGTGIYQDAEAAAEAVTISSAQVPSLDNRDIDFYRQAYGRVFKQLYTHLAPLSHASVSLKTARQERADATS